jgi:hypothetical protein
LSFTKNITEIIKILVNKNKPNKINPMTLITIFLSSNVALLFFLVVGIILIGVSLNANKNDDDNIEVIEHEDFYELPKKDSEIENDIEK